MNDVNYFKNSVTFVTTKQATFVTLRRIIRSKKITIMFYDGYNFGGMHLIWWIVWGLLLIWMFATPWAIPGQRWVKYSPLDILQRRFASGQITTTEYQEQKKILEKDLAK